MTKDTKGNCFVVMPYGRNDEEIAWFAGWYKECLAKGVETAGYTPILSAAEHKPVAINDDIRAHLVFDPMVVCDLGGPTPEDAPNPNVMYELGIRHAFGHPLVIMGWKGQKLPFDVANQRVIMENRRFLDVQINIERIVAYIEAAEKGDYYRPMDAVRRVASLDLAAGTLTRDNVLRNLVKEVAGLKDAIGTSAPSRPGKKSKPTVATHQSQIFHALGSTQRRDAVRTQLTSSGGISKEDYNRILTYTVPADLLPSALTWNVDTWVQYLTHRIKGGPFDPSRSVIISNAPQPADEEREILGLSETTKVGVEEKVSDNKVAGTGTSDPSVTPADGAATQR